VVSGFTKQLPNQDYFDINDSCTNLDKNLRKNGVNFPQQSFNSNHNKVMNIHSLLMVWANCDSLCSLVDLDTNTN
jgi:hypothetical protein